MAFWNDVHLDCVSVVISVWDSAVNQSAAGGAAAPLQEPQSTAAVHSIPDHFQKVLPTMPQRLPNLLCQHDSFSSRTCGYEDTSVYLTKDCSINQDTNWQDEATFQKVMLARQCEIFWRSWSQ